MANLIGASIVMAVFLLVVVVALASRSNRSYTPSFGDAETSGMRALVNSPIVWILGFFAIVGVPLGAAVAYVSVSPEQRGMVAIALGATLALVLAGWVLVGTYQSSKTRGLPSSLAAMVSAWAFGTLMTLAVAVKLLVG
ncbi:hypothetical protein [Haloarchaeobius sp. TZWWS8]|uniref:hypothetical protein n=1 Tax=Haloarchaeobius sp. TZWWS8 TaxID=3446121 RepID=UPI003EBAB4CE